MTNSTSDPTQDKTSVRAGADINPNPATTRPSQGVAPVVVVLLVLVMACISVITFFIGKQVGAASASATQPVAAAAAGEDAGATASAKPQKAARPDTKQPAPQVTDPGQRDAMLAQIRRQADDPRAKGPVDAPVVMVEYGDFSCPMCAKYQAESAAAIDELVQAGKLRVEWRDFSFFRNYNSQLAAAGGVAAGKQGKFWEYQKAAYKLSEDGGHPQWTEELVTEVARTAGVADLQKFKADLADPATAQVVDDETQTAQQLGIRGTPFFIINDRYISGAWPTDHFVATVEAAAAAAK